MKKPLKKEAAQSLREWVNERWEEIKKQRAPLLKKWATAMEAGDEKMAECISTEIQDIGALPAQFGADLWAARQAHELPGVLRKYRDGYIDHPGDRALATVDQWVSKNPEVRGAIISRLADSADDPFEGEYCVERTLLKALEESDAPFFRAMADAMEFRASDASHFRLKETLLFYARETQGIPHHTAEEIKLMVAPNSRIKPREFRELLRNLHVPFKAAPRGRASPNYGSEAP